MISDNWINLLWFRRVGSGCPFGIFPQPSMRWMTNLLGSEFHFCQFDSYVCCQKGGCCDICQGWSVQLLLLISVAFFSPLTFLSSGRSQVTLLPPRSALVMSIGGGGNTAGSSLFGEDCPHNHQTKWPTGEFPMGMRTSRLAGWLLVSNLGNTNL